MTTPRSVFILADMFEKRLVVAVARKKAGAWGASLYYQPTPTSIMRVRRLESKLSQYNTPSACIHPDGSLSISFMILSEVK